MCVNNSETVSCRSVKFGTPVHWSDTRIVLKFGVDPTAGAHAARAPTIACQCRPLNMGDEKLRKITKNRNTDGRRAAPGPVAPQPRVAARSEQHGAIENR